MKIKIYNSDCFDAFKNVDKKIDLVIVDLPYGQTRHDWDTQIDLTKMWIELKKICKVECVYVFFCTTKFGHSIIQSNPKWFRYDLVWQKNNTTGFFNANKMPLRAHEMIYIFKKKLGTYNPQKTDMHLKKKSVANKIKCKTGLYGTRNAHSHLLTGRFPKSILDFKIEPNRFHPTQKPVDLCEWLVKTYSNKNDNVLDFTMGSASTGVACITTKRNFYGIEKDEKIFKCARNRLMQTELSN